MYARDNRGKKISVGLPLPPNTNGGVLELAYRLGLEPSGLVPWEFESPHPQRRSFICKYIIAQIVKANFIKEVKDNAYSWQKTKIY